MKEFDKVSRRKIVKNIADGICNIDGSFKNDSGDAPNLECMCLAIIINMKYKWNVTPPKKSIDSIRNSLCKYYGLVTCEDYLAFINNNYMRIK